MNGLKFIQEVAIGAPPPVVAPNHLDLSYLLNDLRVKRDWLLARTLPDKTSVWHPAFIGLMLSASTTFRETAGERERNAYDALCLRMQDKIRALVPYEPSQVRLKNTLLTLNQRGRGVL